MSPQRCCPRNPEAELQPRRPHRRCSPSLAAAPGPPRLLQSLQTTPAPRSRCSSQAFTPRPSQSLQRPWFSQSLLPGRYSRCPQISQSLQLQVPSVAASSRALTVPALLPLLTSDLDNGGGQRARRDDDAARVGGDQVHLRWRVGTTWVRGDDDVATTRRREDDGTTTSTRAPRAAAEDSGEDRGGANNRSEMTARRHGGRLSPIPRPGTAPNALRYPRAALPQMLPKMSQSRVTPNVTPNVTPDPEPRFPKCYPLCYPKCYPSRVTPTVTPSVTPHVTPEPP